MYVIVFLGPLSQCFVAIVLCKDYLSPPICGWSGRWYLPYVHPAIPRSRGQQSRSVGIGCPIQCPDAFRVSSKYREFTVAANIGATRTLGVAVAHTTVVQVHPVIPASHGHKASVGTKATHGRTPFAVVFIWVLVAVSGGCGKLESRPQPRFPSHVAALVTIVAAYVVHVAGSVVAYKFLPYLDHCHSTLLSWIINVSHIRSVASRRR